MITEFGKYIRKLRIDKMVTLREMADALQNSPAQLSSIETGKRNITPKFLDAVISYFSLNEDQTNTIRHLAAISQKEITLSLKNASQEQKNSAVFFARRLTELSNEDLERINRILEDE